MSRAAGLPKRVLVVDDEACIRAPLLELLAGAGYLVDEAEDGRDALEQLRGRCPLPDAILLDLRMPRCDGWQFRIAQRADPEISEVPVIALSADGGPFAAAIGADAFLPKPLRAESLLAVLEAVIGTHEQRQVDAERAQAERLASVATLAAGIAHEVNNPIACAVTALRHLRDHWRTLTPAERDGLLDAALCANEDAAQIVAGIRSFARPDAAARGILDIATVLDTTAALVRHRLSQHAELVRDYKSGLLVVADEGQLRQVFLNLLLNAMDAIPAGSPAQHRVRVTARQTAIREVAVEVTDTGAGIAPEVASRLFEPFFTTKSESRGIGLSIVHGIVRGLGGTVSVVSDLGKGATFRVVLPAAAATPDPPLTTASDAAPSG